MSSVKTHRGFPVFIHTKQSSCRYTTDFRPPKPRPRPLPAWVTAIGAQERNMRGELSRVGTTKILVAKWWWEQLCKILVGGKMVMQLNDATKEMYEQPNFMHLSGTPNHMSIPFLNQRRNHGIHGKHRFQAIVAHSRSVQNVGKKQGNQNTGVPKQGSKLNDPCVFYQIHRIWCQKLMV